MSRPALTLPLLALLLFPPTPSAALETAEKAVLIVDGTSWATLKAARADVERLGIHVRGIHPNWLFIADVRPSRVPVLEALPGVIAVEFDTIDPADYPAITDPRFPLLARAWNAYHDDFGASPGFAPPLPFDEDHEPEIHEPAPEALPAPPSPGAPYPFNDRGYSEYLIGDVVANVILPERAPAIGPLSWDEPEVDEVLGKVQAALDWYPEYGPALGVTIIYNIENAPPPAGEPFTVEADVDPDLYTIIHCDVSRAYMPTLGIDPALSCGDQWQAYVEDRRDVFEANWSYIMEIRNGPSGAFGYLYGPIMLTALAHPMRTYRHEVNHVFGANDEYRVRPLISAGYLQVVNGNSVTVPGQGPVRGEGEGQECIMEGGNVACPFTRGQLGWRNGDGDLVPDALDTFPGIELQPAVLGDPIVVRGTATVTPLPVDIGFGQMPTATLNRIASVSHRLSVVGDSSRVTPWMAATPDDGAFEGPEEDFTVSIPLPRDVSPAAYRLEVRATNDVGNTTASVAWGVVDFDGAGIGNTPPSPALSVTTADQSGPVRVGSVGTTYRFDAGASRDLDLDGLAFAYDFGDSATAPGPVATHAYSGPGTYTVTLTVDDGTDQSVLTRDLILVSPNLDPEPVLTLSLDDPAGPPLDPDRFRPECRHGEDPPTLFFDAAGSFDSETPASALSWRITSDPPGVPAEITGTGIPAGLMEMEMSYPVSGFGDDLTGRWHVRLEVTDADGNTSSTVRTAWATPYNSRPEAVVTMTPETFTAVGLDVTFDASASTDPDDHTWWNAPLEYRLDFDGDGNWDIPWKEIDDPTVQIYDVAGTYEVRHEVRDRYDGRRRGSRSLEVLEQDPCPVVTSVTPNWTPITSFDREVVIRGDGFLPESDIRFDLLPGLFIVPGSFRYVSHQELRVAVAVPSPATAPAFGSLVVTNPGGCEDDDFFAIAPFSIDDPPVILAVTPDIATMGQKGCSVIVEGASFIPFSDVDMGFGVTVTDVENIDLETLRVTFDVSPVAFPGWVSLTVTNPDRKFATIPNAVEIVPPVFMPQSIAASVGEHHGAAWADYDRDGDQDLMLVGDGDANRLLRNDAPGWTDLTLTALADADLSTRLLSAAAWFDADGDGLPDLYLVDGGGESLFFHNLGFDAFEEIGVSAGLAVTGEGSVAAPADFDGDGLVDLYVGARVPGAGEAAYLFHNDGGMLFSDVTFATFAYNPRTSHSGALWIDHDQDCDLDLYVLGARGTWTESHSRFFENQGPAGFRETVLGWELQDPSHSIGATVLDFDQDGYLDIFVVNRDNQDRLFRNGGPPDHAFTNVAVAAGVAGEFDYSTGKPTPGARVQADDFDLDGDVDLFLTHPGRVYVNQGDGTFVDATKTHFMSDHSEDLRGPAAGADVNGDGDVDIATGPDLFRNVSIEWPFTTHHPFQVSLRGDADALGAVIELTADRDGDGTPEVRTYHVDASPTHGSMGSRLAELGVGQADVVDRLEVVWPDCETRTLLDVPVSDPVEPVVVCRGGWEDQFQPFAAGGGCPVAGGDLFDARVAISATGDQAYVYSSLCNFWEGHVTLVTLDASDAVLGEANVAFDCGADVDVAALDTGELAVVWTSASCVPPQDPIADVWVRKYDRFGTPTSATVRVNTVTTFLQAIRSPRVAGMPGGGVAVTWEMLPFNSPWDVSLRVLDGSLLGPLESSVDMPGLSPRGGPAIGRRFDGSLVVAWDQQYVGVRTRLFDASGTPLLPARTVSATPAAEHASVACSPLGNTLLAWSEGGIRGQVLDPSFLPGPVLDLAPAAASVRPAAAAMGVEGFAIAWREQQDAFARRVDPDGSLPAGIDRMNQSPAPPPTGPDARGEADIAQGGLVNRVLWLDDSVLAGVARPLPDDTCP